MGRFGLHQFGSGWEATPPEVRPLIASDRWRVLGVLLAIAGTSSVPLEWLWPVSVGLALLPLAVVIAARVPAGFALPRMAVILPLGLLSVVFLPWLGGGETFEWAGLTLSRDGTLRAASVVLKLSSAVLWVVYLTATTSVRDLLAALRSLGLPQALVDILETTLRYLSDLARETGQMLLAARCRTSGGKGSGAAVSMKRLGELVGALFVRTMDRGERCAAARQARELDPEADLPSQDASAPAIELEGLRFRYPGSDQDALVGLTLAVPAASKLAVLGVNGAGKTTLLLHFNGVHRADQGSVRIHGTEISDGTLAQARRQVGMVFQNPDDQVIGLTVEDDVRFGLKQLKLDAEEEDRRAIEALSAVGLRERRDRAPFSLSRGERKRAAIAGVLAVGADILVFDEPMASLDPAGKDEIAVLLSDLHLAGKTIVAATHDVDFAATWADTVVIMESGRILAAGPPDLLVNEDLMGAAGLALPLVARPFHQLRPYLSNADAAQLQPPPRNVRLALRWLREKWLGEGKSSDASTRSTGEAHQPRR